jgi:hypothetical protein
VTCTYGPYIKKINKNKNKKMGTGQTSCSKWTVAGWKTEKIPKLRVTTPGTFKMQIKLIFLTGFLLASLTLTIRDDPCDGEEMPRQWMSCWMQCTGNRKMWEVMMLRKC